MYLKQLDILGFKSFADRTRVELGLGITAVVGPNGSGKSNIAEAIRWVLGEQSPRELRGTRMEDVIFGGSDRRKPMGLAEVTLTLDNGDAFLPIDFHEMTLARRVDRSGVSEYLINKTLCRLRDLTALLAGSGLGREAYSYIGQGKIDAILSHRAEDRRPVFEEAAGIHRHKQTKAEALRLLELSGLRMARLEDVLAEIAHRLDPLRREAERAIRWREWEAELRELERSLLARDLRVARHRYGEQVRRNAALRAEGEALEARAAVARQARDGHREQLEGEEREVDRLGRAILATGQGWERARGKAERLRERQAALAAEAARLRDEAGSLAEGLARWREEQAAETVGLARLREDLSAAREAVAQLEGRVSRLEARRDAVAQELRGAREEMSRFLARAARIRDEAAAASQERELRRREAVRLEEEASALAAEADRLAGERRRLEAEVTAGASALADGEAAATGLAAVQAELDRAAADAATDLTALRDRVQATRSRLDVIREMESAYEGFAQGPRTALQGRDQGQAAYQGILGAVAGLIRVPGHLERALEVALGPALQSLVVETAAVAEKAIEQLKKTRGGRATFLPLETLESAEPAARERDRLARRPGALGWAADLVECEMRLRPVATYLLGRVLVAETLAQAQTLARAGRFRYRVVTLEGEVIHPGGPMTGGRAGGRDQGILSRAGEAQRLAVELAAGETAVAEAQAGLDNRQAEAAAAASAALAARDETRRREQTLAEARRDLERAAGELARAGERRDALAARAAAAAEHERQVAAMAEGLAAEAAGVAGAEFAWQQKLAELEATLAEVDREKGELEAERVEARVRLAALEQEERGRRQREEADAVRGRELEQAVAARREALARCAAEAEGLAAALAAAVAEADRLTGEKDRLEAELNEVQGRRQNLFQAWREEEESLSALGDEARRLEETIRSGQVEEARLEMAARSLAGTMAQRFGLDEAAALAIPDAFRPGEARDRVRRLKAEMEQLGAINPRAEAEYQAERARHDFLRAQWDDLERARRDLAGLAAEIDDQMERRFAGTLRAVRREFQAVFARLFDGGRADLLLVDAVDPLVAGIEVVAQPPGKKLQHLSLLSGGERALTAVALLFALLRVRPAPFVILDEIDAPLDDQNIRRFARFLREMAEGVQFIVVTHQKGTMEVADRLLGVTMEKDGASRLVTVRLAGSAHAAAAADRPAGEVDRAAAG